jgi:hypothetical protein
MSFAAETWRRKGKQREGNRQNWQRKGKGRR